MIELGAYGCLAVEQQAVGTESDELSLLLDASSQLILLKSSPKILLTTGQREQRTGW